MTLGISPGIKVAEIQDPTTGLRANVIEESGQNALVVSDSTNATKTEDNRFGESLIGAGATDTVVTITVIAGKNQYITGMLVGGNGPAEFKLYINSVEKARIRNSGSNRTVPLKFPETFDTSASDIIEVKATNINERAWTYECTLFTYTQDI